MSPLHWDLSLAEFLTLRPLGRDPSLLPGQGNNSVTLPGRHQRPPASTRLRWDRQVLVHHPDGANLVQSV